MTRDEVKAYAAEIKALALQMAKDTLKAELRDRGYNLHHYPAKAFDQAAKERTHLFEECARSALKYFHKHYTIT